MVAIVDNRLQTIRAAFPKEASRGEGVASFPDAFRSIRNFWLTSSSLVTGCLFFSEHAISSNQLSVKGKQLGGLRATRRRQTKRTDRIFGGVRKSRRLPRVIRPDLILTENGYIIAEIPIRCPGNVSRHGSIRHIQNSTMQSLGDER